MERLIKNSRPFECYCGWKVCVVYSNDGLRKPVIIDFEDTIADEPDLRILFETSDFILTYSGYSMVKHYCDYLSKIKREIKFGGSK